MPISKHNFEIPVVNYVVKNKHAVLLMNRPFWCRRESTNVKAISYVMRLVVVNTTVNSVANMIYKSGAIISHLPAK